MTTAIHRQVEAARRGELERVIARMLSGWAVLGDPQITLGYCLLLPDPVVSDLNALVGDARQQFLDDMAALGDAVLEATGAERINYEILGNVDPALHAHVIPRHATEIRNCGKNRCGCTTGRRPRPRFGRPGARAAHRSPALAGLPHISRICARLHHLGGVGKAARPDYTFSSALTFPTNLPTL